METLVRNVRDLDQSDRSTLERLVGHQLRESQRLVIQVMSVTVEVPAGRSPRATDCRRGATCTRGCRIRKSTNSTPPLSARIRAATWLRVWTPQFSTPTRSLDSRIDFRWRRHRCKSLGVFNHASRRRRIEQKRTKETKYALMESTAIAGFVSSSFASVQEPSKSSPCEGVEANASIVRRMSANDSSTLAVCLRQVASPSLQEPGRLQSRIPTAANRTEENEGNEVRAHGSHGHRGIFLSFVCVVCVRSRTGVLHEGKG